MYSVAWPISGLFMLCLAAVLGEMASTWPVSGAPCPRRATISLVCCTTCWLARWLQLDAAVEAQVVRWLTNRKLTFVVFRSLIGAMFTWTFRLCRSSRRLDPWARFFSWIVGSFLLVSHILLQVRCSHYPCVRAGSRPATDSRFSSLRSSRWSSAGSLRTICSVPSVSTRISSTRIG